MEMGPKELVIKQEIKEEDEVCFELIEDQSYVKEENVLKEMEQVDSCIDFIDSKSCFVVDGIKEELEIKHGDLDDIQIDNMEFKEEEINCEWSESTLNERDPLDISEMKDTSMLPRYDSAQSSSSYNTSDTDVVRLEAPDSEFNEYQRASSTYSDNDPMGRNSVCAATTSQPTTTRTVDHKYICAQCNYSSAKSCDFKRHRMRHTGEKPFKCDECAFSCNQASSLKRHKMRHSAEKPFKCNECDYSCNQLSHLKTHKKRHTVFKFCKLCDYSCIQSNSLRKHEMRYTGEKWVKCKMCEYSCTQIYYLKHAFTHL